MRKQWPAKRSRTRLGAGVIKGAEEKPKKRRKKKKK